MQPVELFQDKTGGLSSLIRALPLLFQAKADFLFDRGKDNLVIRILKQYPHMRQRRFAVFRNIDTCNRSRARRRGDQPGQQPR